MKSNRNIDSKLIEKAVCTKKLINRADSNRLYAKKDFNLWVNTLLDKLSFSSVLDVCCGTGNQLVLYADRLDVTHIAGIDVSKQALDVAKERLQKIGSHADIMLKAIRMEEMFSQPEFQNEKFDLISCFYGLYYSQDVERSLYEMINHLSNNGSLLIVGPYGKNNATLFSLLQQHFRLPDLVVQSSTIFMEQKVFPVLAQHCVVTAEYFINEICYPHSRALADYWRASTFYFPQHEDEVIRDIEAHFSVYGKFIVEKHVMAYIARKKK